MLPHLKAEIKKADFNINRLKVFMADGPEAYKKKRIFIDTMLSEPAMHMRKDFNELTLPQKFKEMMRLYHDFHTIIVPRLPFKFEVNDYQHVVEQWQQINILSMSFFAFGQSIRLLASEEQRAKWLRDLQNFKMIGCYCQTEIAHGSDVQHLQTTATFQKETDEFIIHTPNLGATKFWPGELGKLSTHALVVANLIIEGKSFGQHMFLVPIRSLENHSLLAGVQAGDVGTKQGSEVKDHGYCSFKNVRIPRTNMLMQFQKVDRNGNYSKQGNPKVLYLFLLRGRASILFMCYLNLSRAITITLRYLSYRKQFTTNPDGSERVVLNYELVQNRVMPILANAFCIYFLMRKLKTQFYEMEETIKTKGNSKDLASMHSNLAGLKPMISSSVLHDLEECRQSCGGQGFLGSAGLTYVLKNQYWFVTVEGENRMIIQQTARYILKTMQRLMQGKEMSPDFKYIQQEETTPSFDLQKGITLTQIKTLIELRSYHKIMAVSMKFNKLLQDKPIMVVWNDLLQSELVKMALFHTETFFFNTVYEEMNHAINTQELDENAGKLMLRMLKIKGINLLLRDLSPLYSSGIFKSNQHQFLMRDLKIEIAKLRPQSLALVESFDFDDQFLYSTLGMKGTDPYDAILKYARECNPLNEKKTLPGFEEYIRPLMMKAKL